MAEVGGPPLLRVRHQGMEVLDHGIQVEAFEFFGVVELLVHGVGQGRVLVQDSQAKLVRPPFRVARGPSVWYVLTGHLDSVDKACLLILGDIGPCCSGKFFVDAFSFRSNQSQNFDNLCPHPGLSIRALPTGRVDCARLADALHLDTELLEPEAGRQTYPSA